MAKEYVVIEDDRCYVDTPVFTVRGDCCDYKRQLIMTKEIFQECYKKWILEEQEQKTGQWIKRSNFFECDSCSFLSDFEWFYCPCCGNKKKMQLKATKEKEKN